MTDTERTTDVIIVGTGFSGLALGATLARAGFDDFIMLERADGVGGAWRDNVYPGAACDIQSHLYSYSFRPNPEWSRVYAPQPEILAYLQRTAKEEGLVPHIEFGAELLSASWDEGASRWTVRTPRGTFTSRVLVSAAGHLSDPSMPDIPGIDTFEGSLHHSARWDTSYDYAGVRAGVIGTGASGIQIVPELAASVERLTVFQRSAPYVVPRRDRVYTEGEKALFARLPEVAQDLRDELFWGNESRFPQRRSVPAFINQITQLAIGHLADQVPDPELRARLTPDYEIGCKRILISNDYYPALQQSHVALETTGIEAVDATGILLRDGRHIDLDLLVVATGFEATELPIARRIHGVGGERLDEHWVDGGRAYASATVTGFPNLFVMLGPNTGLGAGSMVYMIETQMAYIAGAVRHIVDHDAVIEPRPDAEEGYVQQLIERSRGTVWLDGGCQSWYLHPRSGRLTALWPDFMTEFRHQNGEFRLEGYREVRSKATQ